MRVDPAELERTRLHARAELPREACGLILGRELDDGTVDVVALEPVRNATTGTAEDTFEVHPEDHLALERRARANGLDVVGCWHSHPDSAARPSRTDLERAWPGWSYLIVGRAAHADLHVRSWRLDASGRFVEERIVRVTATAPAR